MDGDGVRYTQWDESSRVVRKGTMKADDAYMAMSSRARNARRLLKASGMDHVVYGMMIFEGTRVAAVHMYMWPMDNQQFDRLAARCRCAMVYAVHRKRG